MPTETDNNAERNDRIDKILHEIRETQKRVEQQAAEGRARASQLAVDHRATRQSAETTEPAMQDQGSVTGNS